MYRVARVCSLVLVAFFIEAAAGQAALFNSNEQQINLQVRLGEDIRKAYRLTDVAEATRMESQISAALVVGILKDYWWEFCWELSAGNNLAKHQLMVTLDVIGGNWVLAAELHSATPTVGMPRVTELVLDNAYLLNNGKPAKGMLSERVTDWFCNIVLKRHRLELHKRVRSVPVGLGELGSVSEGEYFVYIPRRFVHFDRSEFRVLGDGFEFKIKAMGRASESQLGMWQCIRIKFQLQPVPPNVVAGQQSNVYLVKYHTLSGEADLGEDSVLEVPGGTP